MSNVENVAIELTNDIKQNTMKLQTEFTNHSDIWQFYNKYFKDGKERRKWFEPWVKSFKGVGATTTDEYNNALKSIEGKSAAEKLDQVEVEWDDLLQNKIDAKILQVLGDRPKNVGNLDAIQLISMENDVTVSLKEILGDFAKTFVIVLRNYNCPVCVMHSKATQAIIDQFKAKDVNVIIVCKGTKENGHVWLQKHSINLPLFIDETGLFYDTLKFPVSTWNTCRSRITKIVQIPGILAGKGPSIVDGVHDANQLGGELIMANTGNVIYGHYSTWSRDRPTPEEILKSHI